MKATLKILALCIISVFSLKAIQAQNHSMSKNYTVRQVDRVLVMENSNFREANPTANLEQVFDKDFPKAKKSNWQTNGDFYTVEFKLDKKEHKALYDNDGNLMMLSEEITTTHLPDRIRYAVDVKYPNHKFEDIERITKADQTFYKIKMKGKESIARMVIDNNGNFVNEWID